MAILSLRRRHPERPADAEPGVRWIEPRLDPAPPRAKSEVFDSGRKTIIDCAHVRVERLDTHPVQFSKVFKEFEDRRGHKYDYRYWAERENFFLREFLKKQSEFTHVVQARHLISENEAAKQVLTCDAGITIANWLRVKVRYPDTATLSHPFQRVDAFLHLIRACLVALKELHAHRIVHCDIKEDNICIPYAPYPYAMAPEGQKIQLGFERLKIIDFAFSVAHSIPLTQILVIDPEESLPYQSDLLVSALRSDRKSGSPNAVQQLDYRVDLFSLGYMAEKIAGAGLVRARGCAESVLDEVRAFVQALKAADTAPLPSSLPHDGLLASVDRLLDRLINSAGRPELHEFNVEGEWTGEEMAHGRIAGRQTPLTPVALAVPTPVARPLTPATLSSGGSKRTWLGVAAGAALVAALIAGFVYYVQKPPAQSPSAIATAPAPVPAPSTPAPERLAADYAEVVQSPGTYAERVRAFGLLAALAKDGHLAATQRIAAFETHYDEVKQTVAKSAWWVKGQGSQPANAARWMEDGKILAEVYDRPAMLDRAFAIGFGRSDPADRAAAVESYLKVIERSSGSDATSVKLKQSATRGLSAMLHAIVEKKDAAAAERVRPVLESRALTGGADAQYYLGLMSECVAQPSDLQAARHWYARAAADPEWKVIALRKTELLGKWCPRRP